MGGVLIIFSVDHTHIQTIEGHTFLASCHNIHCFKMISLENSARASNADIFKHIHKIARLNYQRLVDEPELVDEFLSLCS